MIHRCDVNKLLWTSLAVLALGCFVLGCGSGPRVYKAGGTVTYKGQPVEGAQVTFAYDNGNFANGTTDAAGKFSLTYMGTPGGAVPGKCKVGVVKQKTVAPMVMTAPTGPPKSEADFKAQQEQKVKGMRDMAEKQRELATSGTADLLPKKYADGNTSGLAFEVTTDESKNNFTIDLKD